jgi:ferritin-like protein
MVSRLHRSRLPPSGEHCVQEWRMASEGFHEREERLKPETRDMHRAVVSLMEELEAIDWYQQRMDVAHDDELRAILRHNRDEEMEHAAMVLEWIRRRNPTFDGKLRPYLFTSGSIVEREDALEGGADGNGSRSSASPRPTIGSLRGGR